MALALDRNAFIDILTEGKASKGAAMLPGPEGRWALPSEELAKLPGYSADVQKNQEEARKIMAGLGYGSGKPLKIKVSVRNIDGYRDPAVILIDQLKKIHIEGELEPVDTALAIAALRLRVPNRVRFGLVHRNALPTMNWSANALLTPCAIMTARVPAARCVRTKNTPSQ
jgi:ABC-type transport system substrate-binding protein